ncbi:uncharacterized protein AMSG_08029 [Thecamonas trahens ATCC 50062]|uniref:PH domain-containing protein n=1 Tax=Thecamonas trahens ATCC 50062 TaxID=461836 RepID=A0A0L0DJI4_THETB|nr:hypothetical protein AMSG_08029 [Thecamonas trahens ATCC 50062]KNC52472.1 hypothetical protein AMSG_08029 [Thecamonas trahens ATCC 50062]|eukprot:XP_013755272.1 hypothetical protein AMSG_08029 [Thecamonas trahens ATCC 50062]
MAAAAIEARATDGVTPFRDVYWSPDGVETLIERRELDVEFAGKLTLLFKKLRAAETSYAKTLKTIAQSASLEMPLSLKTSGLGAAYKHMLAFVASQAVRHRKLGEMLEVTSSDISKADMFQKKRKGDKAVRSAFAAYSKAGKDVESARDDYYQLCEYIAIDHPEARRDRFDSKVAKAKSAYKRALAACEECHEEVQSSLGSFMDAEQAEAVSRRQVLKDLAAMYGSMNVGLLSVGTKAANHVVDAVSRVNVLTDIEDFIHVTPECRGPDSISPPCFVDYDDRGKVKDTGIGLDRSPSEAAIDSPDYCGELEVFHDSSLKFNKKKYWKDRWVVVASPWLQVYKSNKDVKAGKSPLLQIRLSQLVRVDPEPEELAGVRDHPIALRISGLIEIVLAAASQADHFKWSGAIEKATPHATPGSANLRSPLTPAPAPLSAASSSSSAASATGSGPLSDAERRRRNADRVSVHAPPPLATAVSAIPINYAATGTSPASPPSSALGIDAQVGPGGVIGPGGVASSPPPATHAPTTAHAPDAAASSSAAGPPRPAERTRPLMMPATITSISSMSGVLDIHAAFEDLGVDDLDELLQL